mmetsp:Transcript_21251/g.54262  ORF Transcript_21251/g.54262 Transcript_21251/m.54262 type:complete len:230 (-) Transcript_21251:30-719(-)
MDIPILHHIQVVAVRLCQRPLAIQLEHDHARIVPDRDQVRRPVRHQDPEAVVLAAEGVDACPPGHVPDADRPVLGVRQDQVLLRVEETARDVVEVAAQRVDFPSLGVVHSPELDQPVVGSGDDQRQRGVEGRPIDTPLVALQHVLDDGVRGAEHVAAALRAARAPAADGDPLLAEARGVPNAHRLVERSGHDQILLGMEVRAHDVVVVPRQHRNARPRLPVPDSDRLIV